MPALPLPLHVLVLIVGVVASDGLLAWLTHRNRFDSSQSLDPPLLVATWLTTLACVAPAIGALAAGIVDVATEIQAGLALALALSLALLVFARVRLGLAIAWVSWLGLSALVVLRVGALFPIGATALAAFMLAGPASAIANSLSARFTRRLATLLAGIGTLVALGALLAPRPTSTLVAATGGRSGLAFVTNQEPVGEDVDEISQGVVTIDLAQADRVVQLPFRGHIAVSKPDFLQLVHLSIIAKVADDPRQVLTVHALGVPLPSGALQLRSATIVLRASGLVGKGTATVVLARSIFGVLKSKHHVYSYLLSYEPFATNEVTGTLELWQRRAPTALR